jgi:hypothetical protein
MSIFQPVGESAARTARTFVKDRNFASRPGRTQPRHHPKWPPGR